MKNILITENQLRLITEALGVPDSILDAAEMLYEIVENDIKSIDSIEDEYEFDGEIELKLGDKKIITIDSYELKVEIEKVEGHGDGVIDIISMGMSGGFSFNRDVYMKETEPSTTLELTITFAVGENWEPSGLIEKMEENGIVSAPNISGKREIIEE